MSSSILTPLQFLQNFVADTNLPADWWENELAELMSDFVHCHEGRSPLEFIEEELPNTNIPEESWTNEIAELLQSYAVYHYSVFGYCP